MNVPLLAAAGFFQALMGVLMFFSAVFLILLVLVQRGRGGGLAGAFGGAGGQSAFGSKAGDTFTRITIVSATVWIVLCIIAVRFLGNDDGSSLFQDDVGMPAAEVVPSDLDGLDGLESPATTTTDDSVPADDSTAPADESAATQPAGDETAPAGQSGGDEPISEAAGNE